MNKTSLSAVWVVCAGIICAALMQSSTSFAAGHGGVSSDARAVVTLHDGRVVVGTTGGMVVYDKSFQVLQTFSESDGLLGNTVLSLASSSDQTLFVGTQQGLQLIDASGELKSRKKFPAGPVRAILPTPNGVYLAVFGRGICKLLGETLQKVAIEKDNHPARLRITSLAWWKQRVVAGTAGSGLWVLRQGCFVPMAAKVPHDMVFAVGAIEDRLYVGTIEGLFLINGANAQLIHSADVRSLWADGSTMWVGTYGSGLLRVQKSGVSSTAPHDAMGFINGISVNSKWIFAAIHGGIRRVSKRTGQIFETDGLGISSVDISAAALSGRRLWVGTFDAGLGYFEHYPENPKWTPIDAPELDKRINALVVKRTENGETVWVGTDRGLMKMDVTRGGIHCQRLNKDTGLPSDTVHAITILNPGEVLVGTGNGAAVVDDTMRVTVIGQKEGLPNRAVWATAVDASSCLWFGTTVGLFRKCESESAAKRFTVSTGHLMDDWVTAIAVEGTRLWIGTYSQGVSVITPIAQSDSTMSAVKDYTATHVGGGYINPAGLVVHRGKLFAATMSGLKQMQIDNSAYEANWRILSSAAPGRDVTTICAAADHWVVGSRAGFGRMSK